MSGYLTHSVSSTGNRKIFTISAWVKINGTTTNQSIFGTGTAGSNSGKFYFAISSGAVRIGGGANVYLVTNRLLRDPSSWYHLVCAVDTSQSTSSNRIKFYVNGVQETSFSTSTYPSQDQNTPVNESGKINTFGAEQGGGESWDGYMTHMVLADGVQLTPSNFGETDSTTGEWKPKADPTGVTYGTNGVFMKCENSGNFGLDSSGQGNNYTANSFPTGAFSTDSASNNFATLNPLDNYYAGATFSEGNLKMVSASTGSGTTTNAFKTSTFGVTNGKWYWEAKLTNATGYDQIGISQIIAAGTASTGVTNDYLGNSIYAYSIRGDSGNFTNNNSSSSYGVSFTTNDIISVALDLDNNLIYFYKNGTVMNSGTGKSISAGTYFPSFGKQDPAAVTWQVNFGNPPFSISSGNSDGAGFGNFEFAVPSGYYALCTKNLNTYG